MRVAQHCMPYMRRIAGTIQLTLEPACRTSQVDRNGFMFTLCAGMASDNHAG
jgi:hypothetical protein